MHVMRIDLNAYRMNIVRFSVQTLTVLYDIGQRHKCFLQTIVFVTPPVNAILLLAHGFCSTRALLFRVTQIRHNPRLRYTR